MAESCEFARELVAAGATLIQLREKHASGREILRLARELRRVLPNEVTLILNDRPDLAIAAHANGVHVGQDDVPPEVARRIIGSKGVLGVSTHNIQQVIVVDESSADYLAIGPVFPTTSKDNPSPVIGLAGIQDARARSSKPLVAIGGITLQNCQAVIQAGADAVAVISELLSDPRKVTAQFLLKMANLG